MTPWTWPCRTLALLTVTGLGACAGTKLAHDPAPAVELGTTYKEDALWRRAAATQAKAVDPDRWWLAFDDPQLDALQQSLASGNLTLQGLTARVAAARAALAGARAAAGPTVSSSFSATRSDNTSALVRQPTNALSLGIGASWELDLWGRIESGVDAARANAQAAEADWAAALLSVQGALTQSYLSLRTTEAAARILDSAIAAQQRALDLTRARYDAGVTTRADVLQAETLWRATQAQAVELATQRGQLEHAIAGLLGRPPASFSLAAQAELPRAPSVPPMLPSALLERRPDIAAAERRVVAARAQFDGAQAAFFPQLGLSAGAGYRSSEIGQLLRAPSLFWSLGPTLAMALLDGGARDAATRQARAGIDAATASYRQTVLGALQEVEDNLLLADRLVQQRELQQASLQAARQALLLMDEQYRAGTVGYLNVVLAQTTVLSSERAVLELRQRELSALAQLLKNAGGRW